MNRGLDRVLDASLNRAAEALRVVEDLCRFAWNLGGFARELKEIRHALLAAFAPGAAARERLVRSRDIEEDVGRASEIARPESLGPIDVAIRNLERAREALRTLEEAGRPGHAEAAERAGELRYRLYSIEKGILHLRDLSSPAGRSGAMAPVRLYLVASSALSRAPLLEAVAAAIAGGAGAVQLREKGLPDRKIVATGLALREITARHGVPLIVNDRVDLAAAIGADGVHLGQEDLPVGRAREILGEERIVGVSTHSIEEARRAAREGADYIGAGAMFPTGTKSDTTPLGPEGLRAILEAVDLPVFPIGGIRAQNLPNLLAAGASRAAVSAGILDAQHVAEVEARAKEFSKLLTEFLT